MVVCAWLVAGAFIPALITPRADILAFTPLPRNRFPNKLAANIPYNMLRNPPICPFDSFLIVLLTPFVHKPDSLRDLTI